MSSAECLKAVQPLFMKQNRNAQPRVASRMALDGIDQLDGFALVAKGRQERTADLLAIAGAGEMADAGRIQALRGLGTEVSLGVERETVEVINAIQRHAAARAWAFGFIS